MYVSIGANTLLQTGWESLAEGLQFFGIAGVELPVNREFRVHALTLENGQAHLHLNRDEDVARLGEQSAGCGCRIAAFLLPNDFNAADLETELGWVVRVTQAAAQLGVPVVRIDAIMHGQHELPLEERQDIFARGMSQVIERTAALPVDFGIENHGFQGNDPEFLNGLMSRVASPRLGLTLDTGNFYWAGHPLSRVYEILQQFAPLTKHTHVKNICYPADIRETQRALGHEYERYVCPLVEGDIDLARVVGFLRDAGYERDLCIEDESLGKYDEATQRANIHAAARHLQSLISNAA